jgi:hypothetical protein
MTPPRVGSGAAKALLSVLKKIARKADFLFGQKIKLISETNHESRPPDPLPKAAIT